MRMDARHFGAAVAGALAAAAAVLAGVFAVLFVFSSAVRGFQLETPCGVLHCREAIKLLWNALVCWGVWTGLTALRERLGAGTSRTAPARIDPLSTGETRWMAFLLVVANVLVWVRFMYRSYARYVVGTAHHPTIPFGQIHLLSASALVASLFLWGRLRKTEGAVAAFTASALFALSPMAFYVSDTMAAGYALLAAGWILLSLAPPWKPSAGASALAAAACLAFLAALGWWLHDAGLGWGGARVWTQLTTRTLPDLWWVPAIVGLAVVLWPGGRASGVLRAAVWPALVGLVFAGSREVAGDIGALLLLPAGATLAGAGTAFLFNASPLSRTALGRNVVVLLVVGMFLGAAKTGVDRGARAPGYVPKSELSAAPAEVSP